MEVVNRLPKISVCMISYNHEQFIEEALISVLNQQTDFTVEIIISDDKSTDGTQSIINRIIEEYHGAKSIKFFPQNENLGIIMNFVFALNVCRGQYISICEGDDYWIDKRKLTKQVELLEASAHLVGSFHYVKTLYQGKPHLSGIFKKNAPTLISTKELIAPSSMMHTSSLVFRRSALVLPDWYQTMLSGDFALASILSASGSFQRINDVMSVYRINDNGVTNSVFYNRNVVELKISILEKLNEFHKYHFEDEFLKVIGRLRAQQVTKPSFLKILRQRFKVGLLFRRISYFFNKR